MQRDQFGVVTGIAIFVVRDEPDRPLGATETHGAFGSEAWVVDAKMKPVEQLPVGRVGEPRQKMRRWQPEQNPRDSVDRPNVALIADFAEVMQQARRQHIVTRALTPQPFAHREQMNLIVGRQRPERGGLRRRENAVKHRITIFRNATRSEGAQTLIEAMDYLASGVLHGSVRERQAWMKLIALAKRLKGGAIKSFVIDGKPSQLVAKKSRKMIMKP